jgi:hypothetical protein
MCIIPLSHQQLERSTTPYTSLTPVLALNTSTLHIKLQQPPTTPSPMFYTSLLPILLHASVRLIALLVLDTPYTYPLPMPNLIHHTRQTSMLDSPISLIRKLDRNEAVLALDTILQQPNTHPTYCLYEPVEHYTSHLQFKLDASMATPLKLGM